MTERMTRKEYILIVGALGRIGYSLARHMRDRGFGVIGIDYKKLPPNKSDVFDLFISENISAESILCKTLAEIKASKLNVVGISNCLYWNTTSWAMQSTENKAQVFEQNINGLLTINFLLCNYAESLILRDSFMSVVLLGSIHAIAAPKFEHYQSSDMTTPVEYTIAKHGLVGLVRYEAKRNFGSKIRINCVSFGGIRDGQPSTFVSNYRDSCSRIGLLDPGHVVPAISFLLSHESQAITGQNIIVDDGWSL